MTIDQFLERLSETPRTWGLNYLGWIRDEDGRCPLHAVAGFDYSETPAQRAMLVSVEGTAA